MVVSFQIQEEATLLELGTNDKLYVTGGEEGYLFSASHYPTTNISTPVSMKYSPEELGAVIGKALTATRLTSFEFPFGNLGRGLYNPDLGDMCYVLVFEMVPTFPKIQLHVSRDQLKAFKKLIKETPQQGIKRKIPATLGRA